MPYKNIEDARKNKREYYLKNQEKIREYHKSYEKEYRLKNREKLAAYKRKWRQRPENLMKSREYAFEYRQRPDFKEEHRRYVQERRKTDVQFMIQDRLRSNLRIALKKYANGKIMTSEKYGIDYEAIAKKLLPIPFSMEERNKHHIDHIIALVRFDLTDPEQVRQAFSPENLQWLTTEENCSKQDKFI
jgi:hypothetical protein